MGRLLSTVKRRSRHSERMIISSLFIPSLDNVYLPSWQVNVALFVVFGCASALGFAILRYRCGEADLARALWEQAKWTVRAQGTQGQDLLV